MDISIDITPVPKPRMVRRIEIKPGTRFKKLTVIKEVETRLRKGGLSMRVLLCSCDCGGTKEVLFQSLRANRVGSCGCVGGSYGINNMKATNEQLIESYSRLNSVWEVAKEFGMCGQSVQERLKKINIPLNNPIISDVDLEKIRIVYESGVICGDGKLKKLSSELHRTIPFISRKAKTMGLTISSRKKSKSMCESIGIRTKRHIKENGHPKGYLGHIHSESTREKLSIKSLLASKRITKEQTRNRVNKMLKTKMIKYGTTAGPRTNVTWKQGWRDIGGINKYYRSRWEANYARYLEFLKTHKEIVSWEHEPDVFWFEEIKRGVRSYLPDFKVIDNKGNVVYHEVKGWMDDRSKTKIKRMKKYHPTVKLLIIDAKWFKANGKKLSGIIKDWEFMGRNNKIVLPAKNVGRIKGK